MTDPVEILEAPEAETNTTLTRRKKTSTEETTRAVKKVKILIPKTQHEKSDVYVAVNDYDCLIKRGVVVEVPEFVVNVLRDAVETRTDMDGNTNDVPCYPFQIVG